MTKNSLNNFLLFTLLIFYIPSFAQLVNIEKERKSFKPGFQGVLSFSLKITENTSRIIQGNNTTNIQFITKNLKYTFLILNDYTIMKVIKDQDDFDLINKNFQHFRFNYLLGDTSSEKFGLATYEAFFQRQQNKIKYIKLRLLFGTGLRFRIINNEYLTFYLSPLFMFEHEELSDSAQTRTKQIKGDFYTSINFRISDKVKFTNVTYYQPSLFDLGSTTKFEPIKDFRLSSENALTFNIIKNKFQFSFIVNINYDSRPPEELKDKPLFFTTKSQISIKF